MVTDFKVSTEINWSALSASDNLDWDVILVTFSVGVNKNFFTGVKYL